MLTPEELERDIETLQEFLKTEEPKAAKLDEPEAVEERAIVADAPKPKPKPKAKSKPKAKKAEEEVKTESTPVSAPAPAHPPTRLYGAEKLRAKRGR